MALPPGFLDELRSRISIAQVIGRKVSWDMRKSTPGKGDYWAPCPFHQEKTASFHVDDRKGFYYCFGCHAKGDALSFLREADNLGFMDAVERLAGEAGMQMPAADPAAAAKAARGKTLAEVMEAAVRFCRMQLAGAAGRAARDYLDKRGLSDTTRERFEIGFAVDNRTAMLEALRAQDIPEEDIVAAGLAIKPDDGGRAYDRFRGRIMFPIRDGRGRAIAFGGRAMDPNARAKYLNSPETPLFDKGRALYNVGPARAAAGKAGGLIVAEGYMDVIALAQAGFDHAVAPLGTAITEAQLDLMWKIAAEPTVALDGDRAGLQAAMRLIDVALTKIGPDRALRFCLMPPGVDPDDLIRQGGAAAMEAQLAKAVPMVDLLWQRETEGQSFDSPERRRALDARLKAALDRIADPGLRQHYRDALWEMRRTLFAPQQPAKGAPMRARGSGPWRPAAKPGPLPSTKATLLATDAPASAERIRESVILCAILTNPGLLAEVEGDLDTVSFACPDLDAARRALLNALAAAPDEGLDAVQAVAETLGAEPLVTLRRIGQVRDHPHLAPGADPDHARAVVTEELAKIRAAAGAEVEFRDAADALNGIADEAVTWRLQQAGRARDESLRAAGPATGDGENESETLVRTIDTVSEQAIQSKRKR